MISPKRAVFFLEEDQTVSQGDKPLALEVILGRPILSRSAEQLLADGTERFFVVCGARFADEARRCFPEGTDVTVSEQGGDLAAFLDTPEEILVMTHAAIPMKSAGVGFVYAAAGRALQIAWADRLTNAVTDARLIPGWLPVLTRDTIAELEPLLRKAEA